MNKNIQIILGLIVLAGVAGLIFYQKNKNNDTPPVTEASVKGCYVANLAKDVYTLRILTEQNGVVTGTLHYDNFEKDSSRGTFTGTYRDGILLGYYSFDSEGMHSESQVIFKKMGNAFVQGFGPIEVVGNRSSFTDINQVTFDSNSTFNLSLECKELTDDDILFDVMDLPDK